MIGLLAEIQKIVKNEKREITPKKIKKMKKVKDTILRYSHIGIYVKISVSNGVCSATTDKQTYRVKTEETFFTLKFFLFCFHLKRRFPKTRVALSSSGHS